MNTVALRARLAPYLARWQALPLRDRRALLALGTFFLCVVVWLLVIQPVRQYAARAQADLAAAREDLAWMQANASAARRAAAAGSTGKLAEGQSLLSAINASAREAGLNLQRFEPDGERRVRVSLENAVLADVLAWIVLVEQRHGLVVENFNADSLPQPGLANIRLTLGVPP